MPISFKCPKCGKAYRVADALAGKVAKCKACNAAMPVPGPAVAVAAGGPVPIAPVVMPQQRVVYRPVQATTPESLVQKLPPWVQKGLAIADRFRPKSMWMWVLAITVLGLVVGFMSSSASGPVMKTMAIMGGGLLAIACLWMAAIGLTTGAKGIVGVIAGAPLLVILSAIAKASRAMERNEHSIEISWTAILIGIPSGVLLVAVCIAAATDPKAFRVPLRFAWMGLVLLGVCWVPFAFHALTFNPYRQVAAASRNPRPSTYTPPGPRTPPQMSRPPTANPIPTPRPSPSASKIEVKTGNTYYTATVIREERGWIQVKYPDGVVEWVEGWRIRPAGMSIDSLGTIPPASPDRFGADTPAPTSGMRAPIYQRPNQP